MNPSYTRGSKQPFSRESLLTAMESYWTLVKRT
jgi:hypothetical protein